MGTVKMGKNKNKKQVESGKTNGFPEDVTAEPSENSVQNSSCSYCDVVSFDVNDQENYESLLKKFIEKFKIAHNITKNTKALLELKLTLQPVVPDLDLTSKDANRCSEEKNETCIQKDDDNLPKDKSDTSLASDAEPKFACVPVEDVPDARPVVQTADDEKPDCPPTPVSSLKGVADQKSKPVFAGLPIDDSANAWMDDDVCPIVDDKDDSEKEEKPTVAPPVATKTNGVLGQAPKSGFAGLPMDDAADSWMNDDIVPMEDS